MAELWKIDVCVELIKAATYRSITEFDIISSTREACSSIVSTGTMKECLRILVEIGFIKYDESRTYQATEQGKKFAAVFDEIWMAGEAAEYQPRMISYKGNYRQEQPSFDV